MPDIDVAFDGNRCRSTGYRPILDAAKTFVKDIDKLPHKDTLKSKTLSTTFDKCLKFAEANDIDMDSGCRAGACGTCITAVLKGDVNYATEPSADVNKGSCLTCISTPKSDMELDA